MIYCSVSKPLVQKLCRGIDGELIQESQLVNETLWRLWSKMREITKGHMFPRVYLTKFNTNLFTYVLSSNISNNNMIPFSEQT